MKRQPHKKPIDRHELEAMVTQISGLPRPLARRALAAVINGISEAVLTGRPLAIKGFFRLQTDLQTITTPFCGENPVTVPRIQVKWSQTMRHRLREVYLQNPGLFINPENAPE